MSGIQPGITCIYFLQRFEGGPIKIGFSIRPGTRRGQIENQIKARLGLLGIYQGGLAEERRVHALFADSALGGEWFEPSPQLEAYWRQTCTYQPREQPTVTTD
jgi:hypothetical protein